MPVLHVIGSAGYGGGEQYLFDLTSRTQGGEYTPLVVATQGEPLRRRLNAVGVPVVVTELPRKPSLRVKRRICAAAREHRCTIIHSHGYRSNFYAGWAALSEGLPHVSTVHVSLFDYVDTPFVIRLSYMAVERLLSVFTRKYICVSRGMMSDMRKLGIPESKIVVIPNGIDPDRFVVDEVDTVLRSRLKIPRQSMVIGTVGRMVTEKGQLFLIRALGPLIRRFPDLIAVFVGDGPLRSDLIREAARLNVGASCRFPGTIDDIHRFYPLLDVFVLPSLREPFGLSLIEAMAAGRPVVATAAGGPLEIVADGLTGVLVPPGDSGALAQVIQKLLLHPEAARSLGRAASSRVAEVYHVRRMVDATTAVYDAVH